MAADNNLRDRKEKSSAQGLWRPRIGADTSLCPQSIGHRKLQDHSESEDWRHEIHLLMGRITEVYCKGRGSREDWRIAVLTQ